MDLHSINFRIIKKIDRNIGNPIVNTEPNPLTEEQPDDVNGPQIPTIFNILNDLKKCHKKPGGEQYNCCYCADKIVEEICNSIVGETWYKWDGTTKYYPSIVFIFLEKGVSYPKKAQVKTHLTKLNPGIQPSDFLIDDLSKKIETNFNSFSYISGDFRCNFISKHKSSWKTTLFVKDFNQGEILLSKILDVLQENFDHSSLSGTSPRTRTQTFLEKYPTDRRYRSANQELSRQVEMFLYKAVLLCNGLPLQNLYKKTNN